jgi:hypothetical protein
MWDREYRPCATTPIQVSNSHLPSQASSQERTPFGSIDRNQLPSKKRRLNNIDDLLKEGRKLNLPRAVGDEPTLYLNGEFETDENLVPIHHWLRGAVQAKYPSLSRFAIDVYACPTMSSEAERVFSTAGYVVDSRRRRITEETSEALQYCASTTGAIVVLSASAYTTTRSCAAQRQRCSRESHHHQRTS